MWESINTTGVSHYTVYYTSISKLRKETDSGNVCGKYTCTLKVLDYMFYVLIS